MEEGSRGRWAEGVVGEREEQQRAKRRGVRSDRIRRLGSCARQDVCRWLAEWRRQWCAAATIPPTSLGFLEHEALGEERAKKADGRRRAERRRGRDADRVVAQFRG